MIRNEETGWSEATIVINGQPLTFAEAMTFRVALQSYMIWLSDPDNGDNIGRRLAAAYLDAARSINEKLHTPAAG